MTASTSFSRRDWVLLAACVCTMALPDIGIWMRPAVTNTLMVTKGFTEGAAGAVVTGEILGFSGAMLLCARLASGISFRTLGVVGFVLSLAMSLASIAVEGLAILIVVRALTAIGFGIMATAAYAAASRVSDTGRAYGYLFSGGMLLSFLALFVLPQLQPLFGPSYAFWGYICFAAAMLPIMLLLPARDGFERAGAREGADLAEAKARWSRIVVLSIAFSIQAIPFQGVWAFFYVLASERGLAEGTTGVLVSISTLASLMGSLSSASLSRLVGRTMLVLGAITAAGASIIALLLVRDPIIFGLFACMLMFVLFAFYPAIFSAAADIDPSGRGASFLQGLSMLVGASGPLIVGALFKASQIPVIIGGTIATALISGAMLAYVFWQLTASSKSGLASSDAGPRQGRA